MRRLWLVRRTEFALSIAAFLGVAILGVLPGIALAVLLSILNVFRRAWWPYSTTLGLVDLLPGYHDTRMHHGARTIEGLKILRFDAPLLFANSRSFREQVRALAAEDPPPRWIVVAAEPITDVDTTAADMLEELDEDLNRRGISLVFAELKDPGAQAVLAAIGILRYQIAQLQRAQQAVDSRLGEADPVSDLRHAKARRAGAERGQNGRRPRHGLNHVFLSVMSNAIQDRA